MNCVACGASELVPKVEKQGVTIFACRKCGTALWAPEADFLPESVYDASYFEGASEARGYDDYSALETSLRYTFRARLKRLPAPNERARLLDVGAAYGFAVAESCSAGWRATGIDVSVAAAARGARVAPGRVLCANALGLPFATASFDCVTMWDVIEHLRDPRAAAGEVARVLRPEGRFVLTTGDVGSWMARLSGPRWHLYTLPEHLHFFSREGLVRLLEPLGFRVESMRAEGGVYTLGYLVERLRKTLLGRTRSRPFRWPGSRVRVPVNLFDVVTVRAIRV